MDISEIRKFEEAAKIGKKALELALSLIEPGAYFYDVAEKTEALILENGGKPAFPLNLSVDSDAAHYTPYTGDKTKFATGQLVKVDIGAQIDGYPSDNAATIEVGNTGKHSDLIDASRNALNNAIRNLRPTMKVGQIGAHISKTITSYGFKPIRNLGGHGISRYDLHSRIFIPNYDDGNGRTLEKDSVIAIEPFASTGTGMIHNGPGGNIYILSGTTKRDEVIMKNFSTLPFAERWLSKVENNGQEYLKQMMKKKEVSQFPILREHRGVFISQAEHTILVRGDEIRVLTS